MKRRSFFGALAGLALAPFAAKASQWPHAKINFQPPLRRICIDWYRVMQEKLPDEPDNIGYFLLNPPPMGEIRYRVDDGEWQKKGGPLPLRCEEDLELIVFQDKVVVVYGPSCEICLGNPDLPLGLAIGFADFEG